MKAAAAQLQFGHGREAVEIIDWSIPCPSIFLLQFGHGREAVEIWHPHRLRHNKATDVLQFGHGREAVEMQRLTGCRPQDVWLQFGHGREAVEIPRRGATRRCRPPGFNSATAVRPWRSADDALAYLRDEFGFNSATAVRPWRLDRAQAGRDAEEGASIRPRP